MSYEEEEDTCHMKPSKHHPALLSAGYMSYEEEEDRCHMRRMRIHVSKPDHAVSRKISALVYVLYKITKIYYIDDFEIVLPMEKKIYSKKQNYYIEDF
jgi:hypothetical protein